MAIHNRDLSTNISTKVHQFSPNNNQANYQQDLNIETSHGLNSFEQPHPLKEYLRVILVYRRLIAAVALIIILATTIHAFTATPMYTASTEISIGAYAPTVHGTSLEDSIAKQSEKQDFLETQIKLISRLTLADKVLSDPDIGERIKTYIQRPKGITSFISNIFSIFSSSSNSDADKEDGSKSYQHPLGLLNGYLHLINISPVRRTSLVKVSATTSNPQLSADLANAHGRSFIEITKEDKQRTALNNLVFLRGQAEDLASKVAVAEQDVAQYAEENAIVAVNQDENIVLKRMSELSQLLTEATSKRIKSEAVYNEAKAGGGAATSESANRGLEDLRLRLREAEAEYADLGQKFKPSYPAMKQLKAKIDSIKVNMGQQGTVILKSAEAQYKSDLAAEEELKRELEIQKSGAFDLSKRSVKFNTLKREFESLKDLHQSVLRQLKEAQINAESEINNITLTDKAAIPQTHSSPNRPRNILLSIIIGPIIGFLLALFIEIIDNTIETAEEVQRVLQLPSLGVIPSFDSEMLNKQPEELKALHNRTFNKNLLESGKTDTTSESTAEDNSEASDILASNDSSTEGSEQTTNIVPLSNMIEVENNALVTVNSPFSATSEAFRAVRTSILLSSADNSPRVVLITSSRKSEGKTTLSSNLALTIAGTVKNAIIIDCDLRRSAVHNMFGISKESLGTVDYLTGLCPLEDAIHKTTSEKLDVMPAGSKPPNPAELLGSKKMLDLISILREKYEFILIDSPPVLPVTDAVILSRIVDGVILVVRGQKTETSIVKETRNRIQQVGGKILGVILNGVDVKKGQHYYYYRDSYSEYYGDDEVENKKNRIFSMFS